MTDRDLSIPTILNDAIDVVRQTASPWGALLFLAALPFRFLQVEFVERLAQLGSEAKHYRHALQNTATLAMLAFVLLTVARLVFVRACSLSGSGQLARGPLLPLRVAPASLALYLVLALLFQTISIVLSFTILVIPIAAILTGVAAAVCERLRTPSLSASLRPLGRYTARPSTLTGLLLVLAVAFLVIALNLYFGFLLLLWLAHGVGGFDVTRWSALFSLSSRLFDLLLVAGALALLEPFWFAICSTYVKRIDSHRSGDDLRAWLHELMNPAAAEEATP